MSGVNTIYFQLIEEVHGVVVGDVAHALPIEGAQCFCCCWGKEKKYMGLSAVLKKGSTASVCSAAGGAVRILFFSQRTSSAVTLGHGYFLPSHQHLFLPLASGYCQGELRVLFSLNAGGNGTENSL